jgi:acyl-CoA thioester hydrolase
MQRPESPRREKFPYFAPVTLRWNDCDVQGHVNNTVPFQLFDTVVSFWQIENGLFHSPDQPICVVARQACNFFAEIAMMDKVVIGLAVERLGSSSIAYDLGLFVGEQSTAAVQGEFVHVVVDQHTRRTTPIPEFARRALMTLSSIRPAV